MTTARDPDLYAVLGVGIGASDAEVRAAYLRLARTHHPDRQAGADEATRRRSEARMQQVNRAWTVLGDPEQRAHYDAGRARSMPPEPPRWRPDGGANPAFVPYDDGPDDDLDAALDEADVFPDGPGHSMPRGLQVLPAALAALAFGALVVGFMTSLPELVGVGVVLGVVALAAFVAVPIVAVARASRRAR